MKLLLATTPQINSREYEAIQLPLNLGYLTEHLKTQGIEVIAVDAYGLKMEPKALISLILKENPDLVGFSGVLPHFNHLKNLINDLRKEFTKPIVVGGPIVMIGKPLLDKLNVNFLISGEGEYSIPKLMAAIQTKKGFEKVEGLIYRKGNQILENKTECITNLENTPFPKYEFLPIEKYLYFNINKKKVLNPITIITSRGCPAQCIFCCRYHGNTARLRPAQHIISEITYWVKNFGHNEFNICDSTFTIDKKRVLEFCDLLKKNNLKIKWSCQSRINTIDAQMMKRMRESGCKLIYYGVESGSQRVLNFMKKGIKAEKVRGVFSKTKKMGIGTLGSFIVGTPTETKQEIGATIKLVKRLPADFYLFSIFKPYPGTEAFELLKKENTQVTDDYALFGGHNLVFENTLSQDYLKNIVKEMYIIQSEKILRKLKAIKNLKEIKNQKVVSWFDTLEAYMSAKPNKNALIPQKEILELANNIFRWNNTYYIYVEIIRAMIS